MNIANNQINYAGRDEAIPVAKTFLSGVFMWMGLALSITALVSWLFASNQSLMSILYDPQTGSMNMAGWIVMLAPLGLVLWMSMGFQKLSASTLVLIFIGYSALMGASLSFIFLIYTLPSIAKTFVITAAMFGFMGVLGYTTKTDLTTPTTKTITTTSNPIEDTVNQKMEETRQSPSPSPTSKMLEDQHQDSPGFLEWIRDVVMGVFGE